MSSACISARTPPTATTVFIYDAYTLRRTVVRALGHTAARKYDRYFAIAENPILINALLRKNAALDPDHSQQISKAAVLGDANEVLKAIHKLKRRAYLCAASAPAVAGGVRA